MPDYPPSSILNPRRLLVRGVNWLGDAVMTTPALQRVREAFPRAHIMLLTHEKLRPLWQQHPSVDTVITFQPGERPWAMARRLRSEGFDAALVLPNSPRSALEVWLARIPRRIGYAARWRSWLLTQAVQPRPARQQMHKRSEREIRRLIRGPAKHPAASDVLDASEAKGGEPAGGLSPLHQIHEYLHLAAALGASATPLPPRLEVTTAEIEEARRMVLPQEGCRASGPPLLLGLNPGAQYGPAKRWPAESFAQVARAGVRPGPAQPGTVAGIRQRGPGRVVRRGCAVGG